MVVRRTVIGRIHLIDNDNHGNNTNNNNKDDINTLLNLCCRIFPNLRELCECLILHHGK